MTPYETYYVYAHVDPDTEKIVYVGIGKGSRAWVVRTKDTNYGHRSEQHGAWMGLLLNAGKTPDEWVKIIHKRLAKRCALEIEKQLIEKLKPQFNKIHNKDHWTKGRLRDKETCEFAKALHEMGYGYQRIGFILGADKPVNFAMNVKRMLTYV